MVALATDNSEAAICMRKEASKRMVSSLLGVAMEIESYLQRIGKNTSSNSLNIFSQQMVEKAIKEGIIDEEYYYYGRASVNHAVASGGEGISDTMTDLLNAIGNMFSGGGSEALTAGAFAASSMEFGGGISTSSTYEVALEGVGYQNILYFLLGVAGAGALEASGDAVNKSEKRREEENRRKAEEAAEKKRDSESGNINLDNKPTANSSKLQNFIDSLYKGQGNPNQIGNGSTMDSIRYELETGNPVEGKFHSQKGREFINGVNKLINGGGLDAHDEAIARAIVDDIANALAGK